MVAVQVITDTRGVTAYGAQLGRAGYRATKLAAAVVAKTTFDCQRVAKQMAPVDTGALRAGIQADVWGLVGEVVSTAEYSAFQEYGTWKMRAHPFMGPAREKVTPGFVKAMGEIPGKVL